MFVAVAGGFAGGFGDECYGVGDRADVEVWYLLLIDPNQTPRLLGSLTPYTTTTLITVLLKASPHCGLFDHTSPRRSVQDEVRGVGRGEGGWCHPSPLILVAVARNGTLVRSTLR